jgi:hypothetical protein
MTTYAIGTVLKDRRLDGTLTVIDVWSRGRTTRYDLAYNNSDGTTVRVGSLSQQTLDQLYEVVE